MKGIALMGNTLKKKYSATYIKLILCIIMVIDAIVLCFSGIMYSYYKIASKKEVDSLNNEIVSVVQNNIGYMSEVVDNYVMSEFYRDDTSKLMNTKTKLDRYEVNTILNRITATANLQSMISNVGIYNGNLDEIYSVSSDFKADKWLNDLLSNRELIAFKPYPRDNSVLTYVIYKGKNASGKPDGAMIVDVKLEWLKNLIKSNNIEYTDVYMIDKSGNVVIDINNNYVQGEHFERKYTDEIINIGKKDVNKIYKTDEKHKSVTYSLISKLDMIFVMERDYDVLYRSVNSIGKGTILFTFLFLLIGVGVSFLIGDKLYAPIRGVISSLKTSFERDYDEDDITYLKNIMVRLKGGTELANNLTKTNMLREFLTNPSFFDSKMMCDYIEENEFFEKNCKYRMAVVTITDSNVDEAGVKHYIANVLSAKFEYVLGVDKDSNEKIFVIKNVSGQKLISMLDEELENFDGVFAFVGDEVLNPGELSQSYEDIKVLSKYRVLFNDEKCLSADIININERLNNNTYPIELQDKVMEACKISNTEHIDKCFGEFIGKIIKFTYENYCMALMRISFALIQEYPFLTDNELHKVVFVTTELDEVRRIFHEAFNMIYVKNNSVRSISKSVVDSMKEYIEINMSNFELCSKLIASEFNMSHVYAGRIFRESEKISIAEYITKIRMETAAHLLNSTLTPIADIMAKVGYDNKSKFYRHFKERFDTTPKIYRTENLNVEKLNRTDFD